MHRRVIIVGKGSARRPRSISQEEWASSWDRVFGFDAKYRRAGEPLGGMIDTGVTIPKGEYMISEKAARIALGIRDG